VVAAVVVSRPIVKEHQVKTEDRVVVVLEQADLLLQCQLDLL